MMQDTPIALSSLEHYCYCPRQCALISVDGVWVDNEHVVRGQRGHRRVDSPEARSERGRRSFRAVPVWSEVHGLTGRADLVEVHDDGTRVVPVEYKMGRRHGRAAEVQLCAVALCLEEMLGVSIVAGQLWYGQSRRRLSIAMDSALRALTFDVIAQVRALPAAAHLPPVVNDARCAQCQLIDHCLPTLVAEPHVVAAFVRRELYECES
jgi:CRISPR-associated exonuclease Cas4